MTVMSIILTLIYESWNYSLCDLLLNQSSLGLKSQLKTSIASGMLSLYIPVGAEGELLQM